MDQSLGRTVDAIAVAAVRCIKPVENAAPEGFGLETHIGIQALFAGVFSGDKAAYEGYERVSIQAGGIDVVADLSQCERSLYSNIRKRRVHAGYALAVLSLVK